MIKPNDRRLSLVNREHVELLVGVADKTWFHINDRGECLCCGMDVLNLDIGHSEDCPAMKLGDYWMEHNVLR